MLEAILLAAGTSSRMDKENKLTMKIGEDIIIEKVVKELERSQVGKIIVVVGHQHEIISEALKGYEDVVLIYNSLFTRGQMSSIQAGMSQLSPDADGFMICLGDMPMVSAADYDYLAEEFEATLKVDAKPIIRPTYKKSIGHPVIFHQSYKWDILDTPYQKDCRAVIDANRGHYKEVEVNQINYFFDVDTQLDYDRLLRYFEEDYS